MIQIEPDDDGHVWGMADWFWLALSLAIVCGSAAWLLGMCGEKTCQ